jgi:SAM-dependent methyltransferase
MENEKSWKSTKYLFKNDKLTASRDISVVKAGSRLMADIIAEYYGNNIPKYAKGKLLDLGCGQAPLYEAYKPFVESITCVDWEKSPHNINHIDITCDLSKPLPISDMQYDTIILSDVLEHIPEPKSLISELFRVMNPEGILFINVPFYYCIHEAPNDYYRYTKYALQRFLTENNFHILEITPIGGSIEVFADFTSKHLQFVPLLGTPIASFIQTLARLFSKTSLGKSIKNKSGENFPFGYFVIAKK